MEKFTKQIIVIRKDLNMRKGKMVAQGAHASMAVLTKCIGKAIGASKNHAHYVIDLPLILEQWLSNSYTKICVSVNSEAELKEIYDKANEAGILTSWIVDNGATEFGGVKTPTCIAVGPDCAEKIDAITGHLPLL